jgi:hypothetical protein
MQPGLEHLFKEKHGGRCPVGPVRAERSEDLHHSDKEAVHWDLDITHVKLTLCSGEFSSHVTF